MRERVEIIEDIRTLVASAGYVYALCMMLFEDFHFNPEEIHKVDQWEKLSFNEAALLLGFLIQNAVNFEEPESPLALYPLKQKTYKLLEELHESLNEPARKKFESLLQQRAKEPSGAISQGGKTEFFGSADMMVEPIFYSGTGVYDFQYLEHLENKYKYDKDWLTKNHLDISIAPKIINQLKELLTTKAQIIRLRDVKGDIKKAAKKAKKKHPQIDVVGRSAELIPALELHQYVSLFMEDVDENENPGTPEFRRHRASAFYKGLLNLFTVDSSDLKPENEAIKFLEAFSITPGPGINTAFGGIGAYNEINSHPIIKLDDKRYFVPLMFMVHEAAYESPYYWMMDDHAYSDIAATNRGIASADIVFKILVEVFGDQRTFKNVKIFRNKAETATDIDILCVLGSKALAVQVKSKKLTRLARIGSDVHLKQDFKKAVQDAYGQGIESRDRILEHHSKLVDESGQQIHLSERIDDVYIMAVTTETYPSLTHQAHVLLEKTDPNPFPIVLSVFDLELVGYYLSNPFEFLYYIRQRIQLMDTVRAGEEMTYLGYHLRHKLWKAPGEDYLSLTDDFAKLIDRNYFPMKAGIEVSDKGDAIKKRWKNADFDRLCSQIETLKDERVTDILFNLFELSGSARDAVVANIIATKKKTLTDGKHHDFSLPPDATCKPLLGLTYMSLSTNDFEALRRRLIGLARARKYKCKGDVWIGFGSINDSPQMVDAVVFNAEPWVDDPDEHSHSERLLGQRQGRVVGTGHKVGRNDPCPCGSRVKFKKCCGK